MKRKKTKPSGEFVANAYHIGVRKCCMSCCHKEMTSVLKKRHCLMHDSEVSPQACCSLWKMSDLLKMAGSGQGRVKRLDYLMYLTSVREQESMASQRGIKVTAKQIEEIRLEFESLYGSIYIK